MGARSQTVDLETGIISDSLLGAVVDAHRVSIRILRGTRGDGLDHESPGQRTDGLAAVFTAAGKHDAPNKEHDQ
jgi:hypothetical protein